MIHDRQAFAGTRYGVLGTSLVAWVIMVAGLSGSGRETLQALCSTKALPWLGFNWALSSVLAWLLMTCAMMLPLMLPTLAHIWRSSFAHRRTRSMILCLCTYLVVWLLAGLGIETLAMVLNNRGSPQWIGGLAVLSALVWQCSPFKQYCLNRGHNHRPLSAFGHRADIDAAMLGLTHGVWCVGSCWALMAAAALLPHAHLVAMVLVALLMYAERLDPPARPAWRIRGLATAWHLLRREWATHRGVVATPWRMALTKVSMRRGD